MHIHFQVKIKTYSYIMNQLEVLLTGNRYFQQVRFYTTRATAAKLYKINIIYMKPVKQKEFNIFTKLMFSILT